MHRTQFTVRTAAGKILDYGDFINCPDLADERIARVLAAYPDARVERTEDPQYNPDRT